MTLVQRMAAIRDECFGIKKDAIQKEKDGKKWTERGHIVEAILSEFRPLLSMYGVDMTPNLVERTYTGNRCDVIVEFEFVSLDDPEDRQVIRWAGAGTDNGDKAFAKAGTNALKEMLKKRFLITDRDDAKEEVETVEHQTAEQAGRIELERTREQVAEDLLKRAGTLKDAFMLAQTVADVDRLKRENRDLLDRLPDVTKGFFTDLIAKRKAALSDVDPGDL